ncbi:hypothetical protein HMN09_01390800 [Mycena chlorophos]|uniref:Uncharacterized protein n=1 Tax=Mycena chlorophos TaxID=658473 RepID=A0A8H6RZ89_MYCCL|nr:hypothetical protein HMN09_01390800 [Mycena chlorophos]
MQLAYLTLLASTLLAQQSLAQEGTHCSSLCTSALTQAEQSTVICTESLLKQLAACNECQAELDAGETVADATNNTQTLINGYLSSCNTQNSPVASFDVSGLFTGLSSTPGSGAQTGAAAAAQSTTPAAKTGAAEGTRAVGSLSAGVVLGSLLWAIL